MAEDALLDMERKNMPISEHALNAVVGTYARAMWVNTSKHLFRLIHSRDITHVLWWRCMSTAINRMTDLFKKYNFAPNFHTYVILMTLVPHICYTFLHCVILIG
jgi:hypothetical protein